MPLATTVKVTEAPAPTVWLTGCVVITGAALTVRTAPLLVTEPAELVATIVYVPALPAATLAIVYEALVAPEMFAPLNCH